jgi:hypothetical protein
MRSQHSENAGGRQRSQRSESAGRRNRAGGPNSPSRAVPIQIPPAIQAERDRQISAEGYDAAHDDEHDNGEMLAVATLYWQRATGVPLPTRNDVPVGFPWARKWWKPYTIRRDLERAGALCLAEIDRLKRRGVAVDHVEDKLALIVQAYNGLPA